VVGGRQTNTQGEGHTCQDPYHTVLILMLEYEQSANSTGKGENPGRVFAGSLFFTAGVILLFLSHYSYWGHGREQRRQEERIQAWRIG